jgi:hypothetical protein
VSRLFTPVEAVAVILLIGGMTFQTGREPEDICAGLMFLLSGMIIGAKVSEEDHDD